MILQRHESTDTAVLKQLVLVGRYLTEVGVIASFLNIGDIINGRAETIKLAILQYLDDMNLQVTKLWFWYIVLEHR